MNNSKLITPHREFFRSIGADGSTRYYPVSARAAAIQFDAKQNPTILLGFGVYDTTISTSYAVSLYATLAEAEAHPVSAAPVAPMDVFEEPLVAATPEEPIRDESETLTRKWPRKRR